MSFYLHWLNQDNTSGDLAEDRVFRHPQTARAAAAELSAKELRRILVMRDGPNGAVVPSFVMRPDGSSAPPPGMEPVAPCSKAPGAPACFCQSCRAERAKARAFR